MTFKLAVVEDFDRKLPEKFDQNGNETLPAKSPKTKKISTTFALINLMKGMVGPGCFALPMAFRQAGLWAAFGIDFLLGIVSAVCMIKLVKCTQYLCERNKCGPLDYGQLAQEAFATSWRPLARFRYVASYVRALRVLIKKQLLYYRWFVNSCLIFLQLGICSVFYIFVVDHAKEELTSAEHIPTSKLPAVTDFNGVVLSAGSILYALEGQAMVLPLENKMKHPKDMGGLTGVLVTGVSLVTLIYAGTGFYGYITYGDAVEASITLNLSNSPLNISVKVMLLCVVYSGFLIQQYPLVEMLWPLAKRPLRKRGMRRAYIITLEYAFRYSIVFIALGLSWLIPNLEEIIPLVGVTSGMLLALVLPSVIEIVVFFREWRKNHSTLKFCILLGLDCFYASLGLFFVVTGLQANIRDLIHGVSD
ncbi:transmembrane amino acid transporter protein [Ancylostoma caninum]|uniref:Transmembrane amino acid transporter protein n=1 Tax=Ancylostoma caninum TaxID=29170 RepID=A0A368FIA3_ANCCA|nr:transmembrane amino acid transporter protein [Ancylostoma caninum]